MRCTEKKLCTCSINTSRSESEEKLRIGTKMALRARNKNERCSVRRESLISYGVPTNSNLMVPVFAFSKGLFATVASKMW